MSMASVEVAAPPKAYVCSPSDTVFEAIEKCLDNGVGSCLVVGLDQQFVGRVSLDDIRNAVLDGSAFSSPTLWRHIATSPYIIRLHNNSPPDDHVLQPVLDGQGKLTGIRIDRSAELVQVAKPDMGHGEFRALLDAFISSWISSKGPYVQKFEEDFHAFVGTKHGVSVSNGTVALHLALAALGIGPGDEVIVPSLTFAATINAVLYCGATPVIVDVDSTTWCLSLKLVEQSCTSRTRAIIPVHIYGRPAEIEPIVRFARARDIAVVEDCAEAVGACYGGRMVGQFGDISCFSFYGNKPLTTGEGGMCLTNSDNLAASMRLLRDHGMTPDRAYWHERVGYNYRLTNLQAAIGQAQLGRLGQAIERNSRVAGLYRQALADIPGVSFPPQLPDGSEPIVWLVCVLVPAEKRLALIMAARHANIEVRPFFNALSAMPPYEQYAGDCPNSLGLSLTGLNLPTSRSVDDVVVQRVAQVFRDVLA